MKPRAFTPEEVREKLVDQIRHTARYWAELTDHSPLEKCEGVAFSILTLLDGCTLPLPAFDLIPAPCASDKQYCIDHGENWFEPVVVNNCQLHELFYEKKAS